MNEELSELLRDLFLGAIIDSGEEIQGINFTHYNDGASMLNIRCVDQLNGRETWHSLLVPSENLQMVQDRVMSVPSVIGTSGNVAEHQ